MKSWDLVLIEEGKTMQDLDARFQSLVIQAADLEEANQKSIDTASKWGMRACVLVESRYF